MSIHHSYQLLFMCMWELSRTTLIADLKFVVQYYKLKPLLLVWAWLGVTGAGSWDLSGSTAGTKVSGPGTSGVGRHDSCWVSLQMLTGLRSKARWCCAWVHMGTGLFPILSRTRVNKLLLLQNSPSWSWALSVFQNLPLGSHGSAKVTRVCERLSGYLCWGEV